MGRTQEGTDHVNQREGKRAAGVRPIGGRLRAQHAHTPRPRAPTDVFIYYICDWGREILPTGLPASGCYFENERRVPAYGFRRRFRKPVSAYSVPFNSRRTDLRSYESEPEPPEGFRLYDNQRNSWIRVATRSGFPPPVERGQD